MVSLECLAVLIIYKVLFQQQLYKKPLHCSSIIMQCNYCHGTACSKFLLQLQACMYLKRILARPIFAKLNKKFLTLRVYYWTLTMQPRTLTCFCCILKTNDIRNMNLINMLWTYLVFLTWILELSFSRVISPVSLSIIRTHSF